jgi:preprotein translocase subunit SecY
MFASTIILAAGSMFVLWLGERITDKGIGNGVSIIIMIGIIARMPSAIIEELTSALSGAEGGGLIWFLAEIIGLLAVMMLAIMLVKAIRKVPVQYAKRVEGNRTVGGARQYIPLKLFAANVMPIIFAQAIMFIPLSLAQGVGAESSWMLSQFLDHTSVLYNSVFVVLIIAFTFFYTAITMNPVQMAEDMKRNSGFIPGIKPGQDTANYLDKVMSNITIPGSLFIAIIAILPAFAGAIGIKQGFAQFFGGTSLLILVGVVLDTIQQIESHLLVRHYDGLLNAGHTRKNSNLAAY